MDEEILNEVGMHTFKTVIVGSALLTSRQGIACNE